MGKGKEKKARKLIRKCLYKIGQVLLSLSVAALIAIGITLAKPYGSTKHFSEEAVKCTVDKVETHGLVSCEGGFENTFKSTHPCVRITVSYTDVQTREKIVNASLYDDPKSYSYLVKKQCSTRTCRNDELANKRAVEKFVEAYGTIGQTYSCYPGERHNPEVLLSVIPHWHVLLGMLLPASVFIFAALMIGLVHIVCR